MKKFLVIVQKGAGERQFEFDRAGEVASFTEGVPWNRYEVFVRVEGLDNHNISNRQNQLVDVALDTYLGT